MSENLQNSPKDFVKKGSQNIRKKVKTDEEISDEGTVAEKKSNLSLSPE